MLRKLGIFGLGIAVALAPLTVIPSKADASQSVCWKEQRVIKGYYQEVTVCENEGSNAYSDSVLQSTIYGNGGYMYPTSSYNYSTGGGIYFGIGNVGGFSFPFGVINGHQNNHWGYGWHRGRYYNKHR